MKGKLLLGGVLLLLFPACPALFAQDGGVSGARAQDIHVAVLQGDYDATRRFLDAGVSLNGYNLSGFAPLHSVARAGHIEIARLLLDRGANIDIITRTALRTRDSALHIAARNGHADMVALLIDRGIDSLIRDSSGNTALHDAEIRGDAEAIALIAEAQETQEVRTITSKYGGVFPTAIANQLGNLLSHKTLLGQRNYGIELFAWGMSMNAVGVLLFVGLGTTLSEPLLVAGAALGLPFIVPGLGMWIAGAVYWGSANSILLAQGVSVGTQEHGVDVLIAFEGTGLRLRY